MEHKRQPPRSGPAWVAAASVLAVALPAPAAGQIDYRNLDGHRPARVEDAYPIERHAFELVMAYAGEWSGNAGTVQVIEPELAYGLVRNGQVGFAVPFAARLAGDTTTIGLAGVRLHGLYNLNTESRVLPAAALRAEVTLPGGALAAPEADVSVQAILTRSWGRSRAHLNGAWRAGGAGAAAVAAADRWWVGAALDRTWIRASLLLVGEAYARQAADGEPTTIGAAIGLRWQWRATQVLDLGVGWDERPGGGGEVHVTLGLSTAFAIAGLMPGGR